MSLESGPVSNKGYYDVPICNQFSNVELRENPPRKTNEYQINFNIQNTMNNNKLRYVMTQDPTVPSPSLMYESDYPQSGYYYDNIDPMKLSFDGRVPPGLKSTSKIYNYINSDINPPFGIESFENNDKSRIKYLVIITSIIIIISIACMISANKMNNFNKATKIYHIVAGLLFFNLILFLIAILYK